MTRVTWARWRGFFFTSCVVVFSRHPAAGFRSFDHHPRPLSSSGTTTDVSTKKEKKRKREKDTAKKKQIEMKMKTALKARRTTRVRTKTWSTHRYYNSFIFQGLSFRISPAKNALSLYSLANNSASFATVPRARDCWLLKDTSKILLRFIRPLTNDLFLSSACLDEYRNRETRLFERVKNRGKEKESWRLVYIELSSVT